MGRPRTVNEVTYQHDPRSHVATVVYGIVRKTHNGPEAKASLLGNVALGSHGVTPAQSGEPRQSRGQRHPQLCAVRGVRPRARGYSTFW